jgi:D-isomer specific 2-hydroxyacid dehydrogenase, NAD binding domain/Oxidoreductase family, NAD-binding Rossmann fold
MDSAAAIFASRDVDAVLIATTTDTHVDLLQQAAAAGKPVLCEKPVDLNLSHVNRCADVIHGTTLPIQIGFVRRFDPGHKAVHEAVRAGDIGELHQVIVTSRDPGLASEAYLEGAGGILRDRTIHDFDMAHFILCDEPVEVFAADPLLAAGNWPAGPATPVGSLAEGLAWADVISVNVPKADRPLLGAEELTLVRSGVVLVNKARGGNVDEAALAAALADGRGAAAGLDVVDGEPPAADHPLLRFDQVIVTEHIAGLTREAGERMSVASVKNVLDFFAGWIDPRPRREQGLLT